MITSNPFFGERAFARKKRVISSHEMMTIQGTVAKTVILLLCALLTAAWSWRQIFLPGGNPQMAMTAMTTGGIVGFVLAIATMFNTRWARVTAPLYALAEGFFLGGISGLFELQFTGIAFQAVLLTFATLFSLLIAYRSGLIQVTEKFKLGVVAATGGLCLFYFISMILSLFSVPLFFVGNGLMSIGFSFFVVILAALNLVLDFHRIEEGERWGLPKHMEWHAALGLMVTLIWLYLELLRLLSKMRSRD